MAQTPTRTDRLRNSRRLYFITVIIVEFRRKRLHRNFDRLAAWLTLPEVCMTGRSTRWRGAISGNVRATFARLGGYLKLVCNRHPYNYSSLCVFEGGFTADI